MFEKSMYNYVERIDVQFLLTKKALFKKNSLSKLINLHKERKSHCVYISKTSSYIYSQCKLLSLSYIYNSCIKER